MPAVGGPMVQITLNSGTYSKLTGNGSVLCIESGAYEIAIAGRLIES